MTTPPQSPRDLLPDLPDYDPEPADGVRVGESPVPGLTLRRIMRGHTGTINRIAWSPNGHFLASPSHDKTIRIWDVVCGECKVVLEGHEDHATDVMWSSDGYKLASGSEDKAIRIWDAETWELLILLDAHTEGVSSVAWSPSGNRLASSSNDRDIRIWDAETWRSLSVLKEHTDFGRDTRPVFSVAWSRDGDKLASSSFDGIVYTWTTTGVLDGTLEGHSSYVVGVTWMPNRDVLASCSGDYTIRLWDVSSKQSIQILEGHTNEIKSLSFLFDGALLASKAHDNSIRLWSTDIWEPVVILDETSSTSSRAGLAFHPHLPILATLGEKDTVIRIWELDMDILLRRAPKQSTHYTTAKIVLVGDSGVGKTGLGWRLAHGEFKEHASTHGQQFWVIDDLCTTRADGTECEAVLWDLAGQHTYRSTHALFLDDVDLSLLLFDPTNQQEPLSGVEFWLKQLKGKRDLPPAILVGARADRGEAVLTREELAQFCQRHGISGGYISTSAATGKGLEELMALLKQQILWERMTTTVTTITFKRIKEYVLSLKEQVDRENVLVSPMELRAQLEATDPEWEFSDAEMMTAVGHLETHGYVTILRSSSGEKAILLVPDLLVALVSSIVMQAREHPRSLGSLNESALLRGEYELEELTGLSQVEREILLDAAILRFLGHNICFRETLGLETLLIFPALIRLKRPLFDEIDATDDVSYIIRGAVENVYPALVVLLGYTQTFTRVNQWQNQAQYEMAAGQICGFRQIEERAGEIELVLYYAATTPAHVRTLFQGLFETFLYQRDVEVTRYPPLHCNNGHLQERTTVIKRQQQGKEFLFCPDCGEKVVLPRVEEPQALGERDRQVVARDERIAQLRRTYEKHLTSVKGFRRDRAAPRCFVSHLAGQKPWVSRLIGDLRDAGVHVLEDAAQVGTEDFILLAATSAYQRAWQGHDSALAEEIALVEARLREAGGKRAAIIPLSLERDTATFDIAGLRGVKAGDFRDDTRYAVTLYDLVLTLYAIPFNHPAFESLRNSLHRQWEHTLKGFSQRGASSGSSGLSATLGQAIREALLACAPLESDTALSVLFADERISPWKHHIPAATTAQERVNALIDALHKQHNLQDENALVLFLRVASANIDPATACHHRLTALADELEQTLKTKTGD